MSRIIITRAGQPRAFTLTELLVAVGAVALLTVGVGQIFRSVSRLTGSGQALAEVDSLARSLELRLREDFEAFNRLPEDKRFLVIRMREEGDLNRNSVIDDDELPIYLTPDDRDFDRQVGVGAYGVIGTTRSRAVTRRLDDMAFLAQAPAGQPWRSTQVVQDPAIASSAPTAPVARIYWGHAQRPRIDPNPTQNVATGQLIYSRQYTPDGHFGQSPGSPFNPAYPNSTGGGSFSSAGRNEFAGQWILARQPLLLYGGLAAGGVGTDPSPLGPDIEFAPLIRDLETRTRLNLVTTPAGPTAFTPNALYPDPRYAFHGRVDICAQNAEDAQRWLEGAAFDPDGIGIGRPTPNADAFFSGYYSVLPQSSFMNPPLWQRFPGNPANPATAIDANTRFLRAAIAGTIARPMAEDAPPRIDRRPVSNAALLPNSEAPEDTLMDLHAALASRCSNFEIAWSDGTRVLSEIDFDNDADTPPDYRAGDLLWFDISPIITPANPTDPPRSTYDMWRFEAGLNTFRDRIQPLRSYSPDFPQPEVASGPHFRSQAQGQPETLMPRQLEGEPPGESVYHVALSGGAPGGPSITNIPQPNEVVCVWGYRLPSADGGYAGAWPKPRFIRVRATLHDSQYRLPGGKRFEFVFEIGK